MADSTRIIDGFFKGVPIRIDSGLVTGGRKTVKQEFPNRDTQTIEDLGLKPRTYNLQIVIAPRTTVSGGATNTKQGYFEYRDSIIAVIESKGKGELIHPLYGRIENVVATTYSLNEDFTDFGRSRLNVTFEISEDKGIPRQTTTSISRLAQANTEVNLSVISDVSSNFKVTNKFTNNFSDAFDKINEIIDTVKEATAFVGAVRGEINEFNSFIGQLTADVNTLIGLPGELATSINNIFTNINTLFTSADPSVAATTAVTATGQVNTTASAKTAATDSPNATVANAAIRNEGTTTETEDFLGLPSAEDNTTKAFAGLFNFGVTATSTSTASATGGTPTDENDILPTTAGRIERKQNRAVLNGAVNALSLGYSYVNVSQIEFNNVRELEDAADELEEQFELVMISGSSDDVISTMTNMRSIVQEFFDEQKITLKQIISVNVYTIPARVLSYQYYGESKTADEIIELNNISDVSFVDGTVEIVTE